MSRASKCQVGHNCLMNDRVETIAEAVAATLKAKGLSMRGVSLNAGLSESAIKHITRGTSDSPRIETLAKICAAMNAPFLIGIGDFTFTVANKVGDRGVSETTIVPLNGPKQINDGSSEAAWIATWRAMDEAQRRRAVALLKAMIDSDAA